jgi:hypothetical protein
MPTKVPLSERALIARINRQLKSEGRQLKKKRGGWRNDISGPYYILDLGVVAGAQAHSRIDLEKFARKLDAVAEYEELVEDEE